MWHHEEEHFLVASEKEKNLSILWPQNRWIDIYTHTYIIIYIVSQTKKG